MKPLIEPLTRDLEDDHNFRWMNALKRTRVEADMFRKVWQPVVKNTVLWLIHSFYPSRLSPGYIGPHPDADERFSTYGILDAEGKRKARCITFTLVGTNIDKQGVTRGKMLHQLAIVPDGRVGQMDAHVPVKVQHIGDFLQTTFKQYHMYFPPNQVTTLYSIDKENIWLD